MASSTTMLLLAILSGVAGFAGTHMVERRRFYRRNHAAVEGFRNYTTMVVTRSFEGVIQLASRLLLLAAVGLLCMFGVVRCSEDGVRAMEPDRVTLRRSKESKRRAPPAVDISSDSKDPATSTQPSRP